MHAPANARLLPTVATLAWLTLSVSSPAAADPPPATTPAPPPAPTAVASTAPDSSGVNAFDTLIQDNRIKLRNSVTDQTLTEQPAQVQFVSPRGASSSYAIDVGLSAVPRFFQTDDYGDFGFMTEYHKQTQTAKKLENFQIGGDYNLVFGSVDSWGGDLQCDPVYNLNHQRTGNGFLGTVAFSPVNQKYGMGIVWDPAEQHPGAPDIGLAWQPKFAVQYQTSDNVLKSGESGAALRGKIDLSGTLTPYWLKQKQMPVTFAFTVDWTYWADATQSGGYKRFESDDRRIAAGIQVGFKAGKAAPGFKLEYSRGSNPETGLQSQEQVTLSLTLKI